MNRDRFRLVLSRRLGFRVPVAEHVSSAQDAGRRPRRGAALLLSGLAVAVTPAWARDLPTPAATFIRPGHANNVAAPVMENARTMVIRQLDARPAVMQWQNFDIGRDHTVRFDQPTRQSRAINIVLPGGPRSEIYGNLKANGQVFLFNQSGILFGPGAVVDVGGLVASSLKLNDKLIEQSLSSLSSYSKDDARFLFSEAALSKDGSAGDIDIAAGARIVAAENGRVLIAAPNVTNAGQISTPQGQTILAAGEKLYLADSIDSRLRGVLVEVSGGGTATNAAAGGLLAERGNITLAGRDVNQLGSARATTTVTLNGSIYLQAKDSAVAPVGTNLTGAYETGSVKIGAGSTTSVTPETERTEVLRDDTPFNRSEISAIGKTIDVGARAKVLAPAGRIVMTAQGNASSSGDFVSSPDAAINVAAGAEIDVSGLRGVEVAVDRNYVEVELRGDELKDSPLQRDPDFGRPLYGKKIWIDVMNGFSNSDTPLADITGYRAGISRSVAELSSVGGDIALQSAGSVNVSGGALLDVSGGSIVYKNRVAGDSADRRVPVTYLETATGAWVRAADASSEMRYSGRTRTMRQAVPERVVGHDAGRVTLTADSLRVDGELRAGTVTGSGQRAAPEARARWYDWSGNAAASDLGSKLEAQLLERERDRVRVEEFVGNDLKKPYLTQAGRRAWAEGARPMGGQLEIRGNLDDTVSPLVGNVALVNRVPGSRAPDTAYLRADLLTTAGFDRLLLQADGVFSIARDVSAMGLTGARLQVESSGFEIAGSVWLPGGTIELSAREVGGRIGQAVVRDTAALSTAGAWTNDSAEPVRQTNPRPVAVDGGRVALSSEGDLSVKGSIDVSAGAWREQGGTTHLGDGGEIELATGDFGDGATVQRRLDIKGAALAGYATAARNGLQSGHGGSLSLSTSAVRVVSGATRSVSAEGLLNLGSVFFQLGGFANFAVRGYGGVSVADGVRVAPDPLVRLLTDRPLAQTYGASLGAFTALADLDSTVRGTTSLAFDARALGDHSFGALSIGRKATLETDVGGRIALSGQQEVVINGTLRARSGRISVANQGASDTGPNDSLATSGQVHLGDNAVLDVSAAVVRDPASRFATGSVLDGGEIVLEADYGYLVMRQGAQLKADGTAAVLDLVPTAGLVRRAQTVTSAGGDIALGAREGMMIDGTLSARSGGGESAGGSLSVRLSSKSDVVQWDRSDDSVSPSDLNPARRLELASGGGNGAAPIAAGQRIDSVTYLGKARFDVKKVSQGGFQDASFASSDYLVFDSNLTLSLPGRLTLEAPTLLGDNASRVALSAASLLLTQSAEPGERSTPYAPTAGHTGGRLTLSAGDMEVRGRVSMTGFAATTLASTGDLRLSGLAEGDALRGQLATDGDLTLRAAVVYPTSASEFDVQIRNNPAGVLRIASSGADHPVISAVGDLDLIAPRVEQFGRVKAPFGRIGIASGRFTDAGTRVSDSAMQPVAGGEVVLGAGSLTSLSAEGLIIPYGETRVAGRDWVFNTGGGLVPLLAVPEKRLQLDADRVTVARGATIDLSGGGDLKAWEFISGRGGSTDVLSQAATYAILPGLVKGSAPYSADTAAGASVPAGRVIRLLAPAGGLPAGIYTLLPARYALMDGAYAIRVTPGVADLAAGRSIRQADGTTVVGAQLGDALQAGAFSFDSRSIGVEVWNGAQVRLRSEYLETLASGHFRRGGSAADAGRLSVAAGNAFVLEGIVRANAAAGGRGALVDLTAAQLAVVNDAARARPGEVVLSPELLARLNAESVLLGATRERVIDTDGESSEVVWLVKTDAASRGAASVRVDTAGGADLMAPELILAARESLRVEEGSSVLAAGTTTAGEQVYRIAGSGTEVDGALLRVSTGDGATVERNAPARVPGQGGLDLGRNARVAGRSLNVDATGNVALGGRDGGLSQLELTRPDGVVELAASTLAAGAVPPGTDGLTLGAAELSAVAEARRLTLRSYTTFDLYGNATVGSASLQDLVIDAAGIVSRDNSASTQRIVAGRVTLKNAAGSVAATAPADAAGSLLEVRADEIVLGPSAEEAGFRLAGSERVRLTARGQVIGEGASQTLASGDLDVVASRITAGTGAVQAIAAGGDLRVLSSGVAAPETPAGIGAHLVLEGERVEIAGRVEAHAGRIDLSARSGDVVIDGTADSPARVSAAGTLLAMGSDTYAVDAGTVKLNSAAGDVVVGTHGEVDVSAPGGADAGTLAIEASSGTARLAGRLRGGSTQGGDAGRFTMDVQTIAEAGAALSNLAARTAEFGQERNVRVREGDMLLAASDRIVAESIDLSADDGSITLEGVLDASGDKGGEIRVHANAGTREGSGVLIVDGANLLARGTGAGGDDQGTAGEGGQITLGVSASEGSSEAPRLAIRSGRFDTGSDHARAGLVTLSAPQGADGVSLAIDPMDTSQVSFDAREVALEGYVRSSANQIVSGSTNNSGTAINLGGVYDLALAAVGAVSGLSATNRPVAHETVAMFGRDLLGAVPGDDFAALARADAGSYLGMFAGDLVRDAAANDDLYPSASAAIEAAFRNVTVTDVTLNQHESVAAVIGAGLRALGTPQSVVDLVQADVLANLASSGLDPTLVLASAGSVLTANGYAANSSVQSFLGTADARTLVDMAFYAAKASTAAGTAATPTLALQAAISSYSDDRALTAAQASALATQVANLGNVSSGRYRAFAAARRFIGHTDKILSDTGLSGLSNVTVNHDLQVVSSGDIAVAADVDLGDVAVTTASTAFQNNASLSTGALSVWHAGGNAGRLTLKADGNVMINNNLTAGMVRAFRSTTNAQPQGYVDVMSEPLPAGTPSWAIRVVAGADREAADPLAVMRFEDGGRGSVEIANNKVLRGGEAGIEIAARNDVLLKGSGSAIYTVGAADAGSGAFIASTANTRSRETFARDGGDITIIAGGSVKSDASSAPPPVTNWLVRIGALDGEGRISGLASTQTNPAWFAKPTDFKQGIGTLGGGDLSVVAGGDVLNLVLVTASSGRVEGVTGDRPGADDLKVRGGGALLVKAGDEIQGVTAYAALNGAELRSGGNQSVSLALGDAGAKIAAGGDLSVSRIFNPTLEGSGTGIYFSTYGDRALVDAASLLGDVAIGDFSAGPVALGVAAAAGAVTMGQGSLLPSSANALSVLAGKDVVFDGTVTLGNADPASLPSPWLPGNNSTQVNYGLGGISPSLLAARDKGEVVVASAGGNVVGPDHVAGGVTPALRSALPVRVSAAGDVVDFGLEIGHVADHQVSSVSAAGDVRFNTKVDPGTGALQNNSVVGFLIEGPGRLQIDAGNDVDLANSLGIVARGNARNAYLPEQAAGIEVLAGTASADYEALLDTARPGTELGADLFDRAVVDVLTKSSGQAVDLARVLSNDANAVLAERRTSSRSDLLLWYERYDAALLTAMRTRHGDRALDLDGARAAFAALPVSERAAFYQAQRPILNEILFAAVRYAGRLGDALGQGTDGYAPGYAVLEKTFGGSVGDGGNIEVFLSQIKTEQDVESGFSLATANLAPAQQEHASAIALLAPRGAINVGVPGGEAGDPTRTGVVAIGKGNIDFIARESIEVGPSRIFTLGGGAIQGWSSEGDIDGGSSPKTAAATPPPTLRPVGDGFVLDVSGSVSGGGIATLKKDETVRNAPVRLFAPRGAVDAGDAGIRVSGDLEIGAQQIIGADNISVGGSLSSSASPPPPAAPATVPAGASTSQSEAASAMPGQGSGESNEQREPSSLLSVEVVALGDGGSEKETGARECADGSSGGDC